MREGCRSFEEDMRIVHQRWESHSLRVATNFATPPLHFFVVPKTHSLFLSLSHPFSPLLPSSKQFLNHVGELEVN